MWAQVLRFQRDGGMDRINFLGISVNVAAIIIVVVSVVLALVMYQEPKPPEEITPAITEVVNAATSTEIVRTTPIVTTIAPTARATLTPTLTATATITPTATRPASCAALPLVPGAASAVTGTPLPIAYFYDLDPSAPLQEKGQVIVYRCYGSWDEFILVTNPGYLKRIPLQPGDVIYKTILPGALNTSATPSATIAPSRTVTRTATP
jgi:hypothetical protein